MEELDATTNHTIHQYNKSLDTVIDSMVSASNAIYLDNRLTEILKSEDKVVSQLGTFFSYDDYKIIDEIITGVETSILMHVTPLIVIKDSSDRLYSRNSATSMIPDSLINLISKEVKNRKGLFLWGNFCDLYGKSYLYLARHTQKKEATLIIALPEEEFLNRVIDEYSYDSEIQQLLIADASNKIISSTNKSIIGHFLPNELLNAISNDETEYKHKQTTYILKAAHTNKLGLQTIMTTNSLEAFGDLKFYRNITLIYLIFSFICIMLLTYFLIMNFISPIKEISEDMRQVAQGDFSQRLKLNRTDEIGKLSECFMIMTQQLSEYMEKIKAEQKQNDDLNYQILQAQVNPHFLFNTLNAIKNVAAFNQDYSTEKMLIALGNLLYTSMKENRLITIQREVEVLDSFILLQQVRFGHLYELTCNIPDSVMKYLIPKLSIQPIVDNCFKHGINDSHKLISINIDAVCKNSKLYITVKNNGLPITDEEIRHINENIEIVENKTYTHIGINNVDHRIKHIFGDQYGITISRNEKDETVVEIYLPAVENIENE